MLIESLLNTQSRVNPNWLLSPLLGPVYFICESLRNAGSLMNPRWSLNFDCIPSESLSNPYIIPSGQRMGRVCAVSAGAPDRHRVNGVAGWLQSRTDKQRGLAGGLQAGADGKGRGWLPSINGLRAGRGWLAGWLAAIRDRRNGLGWPPSVKDRHTGLCWLASTKDRRNELDAQQPSNARTPQPR